MTQRKPRSTFELNREEFLNTASPEDCSIFFCHESIKELGLSCNNSTASSDFTESKYNYFKRIQSLNKFECIDTKRSDKINAIFMTEMYNLFDNACKQLLVNGNISDMQQKLDCVLKSISIKRNNWAKTRNLPTFAVDFEYKKYVTNTKGNVEKFTQLMEHKKIEHISKWIESKRNEIIEIFKTEKVDFICTFWNHAQLNGQNNIVTSQFSDTLHSCFAITFWLAPGFGIQGYIDNDIHGPLQKTSYLYIIFCCSY